MLYYVLVFLIVAAAVALLLGLLGLATIAGLIVKALFGVFLALFVIGLFSGRRGTV
jgi:uncharacterized membrane protein YtjA (UPF0391 family)